MPWSHRIYAPTTQGTFYILPRAYLRSPNKLYLKGTDEMSLPPHVVHRWTDMYTCMREIRLWPWNRFSRVGLNTWYTRHWDVQQYSCEQTRHYFLEVWSGG